MVLPIFDQILAGLQGAFSVFYPILIFLMIAGIVLLINAGFTTQIAATLMFGAIFMAAWAGIAMYGLLAIG
ncbi:hypothetical protein QCD75_22095, partial [Arthrobacter sp. PsM3]|nr:hypothetical protein [Arthrobacter sp. PsM3]